VVAAVVALTVLAIVVALDRRSAPPSMAALGRSVFERNCQGCHAIGRPTQGAASGGSLVGYRIPERELEQFTREMPARVPLTRREVTAVSQYVAHLERSPRSS
jgi:mono/diheme cytochrome c family protein